MRHNIEYHYRISVHDNRSISIGESGLLSGTHTTLSDVRRYICILTAISPATRRTLITTWTTAITIIIITIIIITIITTTTIIIAIIIATVITAITENAVI